MSYFNYYCTKCAKEHNEGNILIPLYQVFQYIAENKKEDLCEFFTDGISLDLQEYNHPLYRKLFSFRLEEIMRFTELNFDQSFLEEKNGQFFRATITITNHFFIEKYADLISLKKIDNQERKSAVAVNTKLLAGDGGYYEDEFKNEEDMLEEVIEHIHNFLMYPSKIMQKEEAEVSTEEIEDETQVEKIEQSAIINSSVLFKADVELLFLKDDNGNYIFNGLKFDKQLFEDRVCNNCGKRFSSFVGYCEEKVISLAGTAAAGKSSYLAALFGEMSKVKGIMIHSFNPDDDGYEIFNDYKTRYGKRLAPLKTEVGEFPDFTIKITYRNDKEWFDIEPKSKSICLTFVDMPGELLYQADGKINTSHIEKNRKILGKSSLVWLLISAEQLVEIPKSTSNQNASNISSDVDINHFGTNLSRLCRWVGFQPDTPICCIITKDDLIYQDISEHYLNHENGSFFHGRNVNELYQVICPNLNPHRHMSDNDQGNLRAAYNDTLRIYEASKYVSYNHTVEWYVEEKNSDLNSAIKTTFEGGVAFFSIAAYGFYATANYELGLDKVTREEIKTAQKNELIAKYPRAYEKMTEEFENEQEELEMLRKYVYEDLYQTIHQNHKSFGVLAPFAWSLAYLNCIPVLTGRLAGTSGKINLSNVIWEKEVSEIDKQKTKIALLAKKTVVAAQSVPKTAENKTRKFPWFGKKKF